MARDTRPCKHWPSDKAEIPTVPSSGCLQGPGHTETHCQETWGPNTSPEYHWDQGHPAPSFTSFQGIRYESWNEWCSHYCLQIISAFSQIFLHGLTWKVYLLFFNGLCIRNDISVSSLTKVLIPSRSFGSFLSEYLTCTLQHYLNGPVLLKTRIPFFSYIK